MADNKNAKAANNANKAVHAGKAIAKGSSGNYVGAAKEVVVGFGDDIVKIVLSLILAITFLSSSLFSIFATTPSILTNNFFNDFNNSVDKWQITTVCDAVEEKINSLKKDIEKDIVDNIQDGYISDFKKRCQSFDSSNQVWTGNGNNKEIFIICKDGNDINAFNAVLKDNSYMSENGNVYLELIDASAKKVNFTNIINSDPNEKTEIDPLYFVCAYSVWHQNNDVNDSDDDNTYNEPNDIEDRWYDYSNNYDLSNDIVGLKKFIKNHKENFMSVDYSYQKEKLPLTVQIEHKEMVTDEDGNVILDEIGNVMYETVVKTETIDFRTEAINVSLRVATNDEILEMFELDEEDKKFVDSIYLTTKSLYEGAYENYQNENISFNPKFQIVNDIISLTSSDSNTDIFKAIKRLDDISSTYEGESTNQGTNPSNPKEENKKKKNVAGVPTGYMKRPTKKGSYYSNSTFPYYSSGGYHAGYDISIPTGTKVYAAECGTVVRVKHLTYSYGYHIVIKSGNYYFYYCHLSSTSNTKVGDKVKQGQYIGKSGNTGNSSGPHLHFEVRKGDNYHSVINPYLFMNKNKTYIGAKTYG